MRTLTREDTEYDVEYVTIKEAEREIEYWKDRHGKLLAWLDELIADMQTNTGAKSTGNAATSSPLDTAIC